MSQQRFIRCSHCGLPHEAEQTLCPVSGKALDGQKQKRPRRRAEPPASGEDYAWAHSLHPWSHVEGGQDLSPAALDTFVGRVVEGKYKIQEMIGRGGMGAVFRAENLRIGKAVALKVLYRGYNPGSEAERRFLREARVAGSLGHPNIVEVFDLGHLDDGAPFQVMELLEGQSLAQRIQAEGALPEAEALAIGEQVLSALEAAHESGVIHRDLKPENVFLVDRRGETVAKLLDFGVSKSVGEQTQSITMTGVVVGTPYYLSPEQARGGRDVDHRSDLWAMGVLLYEALTGVLPFNAESYEKLLVKIFQNRPVPPSRFQARLSPAVEALILRALSRDPADRPQSARAMLDELREAKASTKSPRLAETFLVPDALQRAYPSLSIDFDERTLTDHVQPHPDDPTEISERFDSAELRVIIDGTDNGQSEH